MKRVVTTILVNPWREIAVLMVILMEVSWITPWFRSLTPQTYAIDALRVFIILAMITMISYLAVKLMEYLRLKKSVRRVLMISMVIGGSLAGLKLLLYSYASISLAELINRPLRSFADLRYLIPVEFIVIVAVLVSFWRGLALAQEYIGPTNIIGHFWIGIIMFLAFIFLITIVTGESAGDFFFLFLFATLVGTSSSRMNVIRVVRGGNENKIDRLWLTGIILSAFVVVGISLLVGEIAGDKFAWVGSLVLGLFGSLLVLVWLIVNPAVSYIIDILSKMFKGSVTVDSLQDTIKNLNKLMTELSQRLNQLIGSSGLAEMLNRWGPTIRTIFLSGIIVLIVAGILFWMAFKFWHDKEKQFSFDEVKSWLTAENIFQSLRDLMRRGWKKAFSTIVELTDTKKRRTLRAAARIRQVYSDLLDLCETHGQGRSESQTPYEFLPKIELLFPNLQTEVSRITSAYVNVRYGLVPETQSDIDEIETDWIRLQSAGEAMLHEKRHPIGSNTKTIKRSNR